MKNNQDFAEHKSFTQRVKQKRNRSIESLDRVHLSCIKSLHDRFSIYLFLAITTNLN